MTDTATRLLLVDKPAGPTSHDIVQAARRALKERRIGHTGTLDPNATGLLLLCVGKATRLQQFLLGWEKTYAGEIRLGFATTTYDTEGTPTAPEAPVPALDEVVLADLVQRFSGELDQLPPSYSAKKTAGKKFYELARAGEHVPLEPKRVTVHSMRLWPIGTDRLGFEVSCSSGTYVRSLAHDIGQVLGCGGHLASLRRLHIGPYRVENAVTAEALANRPAEVPPSAMLPLSSVTLPFPDVQVNPTALSHFNRGQEIAVRDVDGQFAPGSMVAVRDRDRELVGIATVVTYMPRARTLTLAPRLVLGQVEE
jgi:tRNA pseudouridine55 synthase